MLKIDFLSLEPLFQGLVHEIRNPVQGILASAEALRCRYQEDASTDKMLALIQQECGRIDGVLTDLLDFARPINIDPAKTCSLSRLVQESIRDFQQRNSHAQLNTNLALELPPLSLDAIAVRRAIGAVLQNAFEARGKDAVIHVELEQLNDHQNVRIRDEGEGILSENLDRVFLPFYSTRPKKAGLGLSIASRVMQLHEGTLRIESTAGQGTVVTMGFPVRT